MSKDQETTKKQNVETVENFYVLSDFYALREDYKLDLKNYCFCVYAEKMYKNCNRSISKKKFKTHDAAIRYYKRLKENPKVCLTYMGIISSETF